MVRFGWSVIKFLLFHHSGHDLKSLFLLRKVDRYLDALQLRVNPEPSVLIDGQRKGLNASILIGSD